MIDFDEWFEDEMPNSHKKVNKERIETIIYSCAEASWNHQQSKIDELQARVDEALKILESDAIGFTGLIQNYDKAESILKGNKDEN